MEIALPKLPSVQPILDEVTRFVASVGTTKSSELRLRLKPPSLGSVTVHVKVEENAVSADIRVENDRVRTALETGIPQLREMLQAKGLEPRRIEVVADEHFSSQGKSDRDAQRHSAAPRQSGEERAADAMPRLRSLGYNTLELTM